MGRFFESLRSRLRAHGLRTNDARLKYTARPPTNSKDRRLSLPVNCPSEAKLRSKTGALASTPLTNRCLALGTSVKAPNAAKAKLNNTMNNSTGGTRSNVAESFRGSVLTMNRHNNIAPTKAIHIFF